MRVRGAGSATDFAAAVLAELHEWGVREVVLAPGSRSQALALAAAAFERAGYLRLRVRIDERSAGFLALGLAVESGAPVAIVTTSGGAVANLHPAVLEAHHSGVPLILLTADRPEELRGIGSNQTTHQTELFGPALRALRDVQVPSDGRFDPHAVAELVSEVTSAALGHSGPPGPVQLNLAFREPLSGPLDPAQVRGDSRSDLERLDAPPETLKRLPGTVVVAGHGAGADAERVAHELGAPLLAEVSSGARFGRNLVVAYRELLADPDFGGAVRRAIVFGHPTLSREIPALLARAQVEVIVVRGTTGEPVNPSHRASRFIEGPILVAGDAPDAAWPGRWVSASRTLLDAGDRADLSAARTDDPAQVAEFAKQQLAVYRAPVTRRTLTEAVWAATWPHDRLVLGASRLIREADRVVPGKRIRVHANRGLAGIDGTVSTAVGIALASQGADGAAGVTRVLLGDLALLHDVGGLLFGAGEERPRIQLIVGNDGGGTIFDQLEVAGTAPAADVDRVLYTPQSVDLAPLAAAYGWRYVRASNRGELDESLTASEGCVLIEVPLPRREQDAVAAADLHAAGAEPPARP